MRGDEKTCKKCRVAKPLSEFHRATANKDGHRGECKECSRRIRRQNYENNRDAYIARTVRWREKNPDRYRELKKRYRKANRPELQSKDRHAYLTRTYGLTQEDFEYLVVAQDGRCGICGKRDDDKLHIDHDHCTGLIRGLLCGSCNRAMGLFHEDPARFEAAGAYLRRPQLTLGCGDRPRRPKRPRRLSSPRGQREVR